MAIFTFNQALQKNGVNADEVKSLGVPGAVNTNPDGPSFGEDLVGDVKQVGADIASSFNERAASVQAGKQAMKEGKQSGAETLYQTAGQAAGLVSDVFGSVIKGGVKALLPQSAEDAIKKGVKTVAEPVVNTDLVKNVIQKYHSLDEETKRNVDAALGIGSLATDIATFGGGKKVAEVGVREGLDLASKAAKPVVNLAEKGITATKDTIESFGSKLKELKQPEVSEATKVSLNPSKALAGTGQDIEVSIGGKLKKLSETTPEERVLIQTNTRKNLDTFTEQAKKFAKDRSTSGGSPVEIVGQRVDKALELADKERQNFGRQMGEIETRFADVHAPVGKDVNDTFVETLRSFDNPKFGADTADAVVVRKLVKDYDLLEKSGASIADRLDFVRSWDRYLNDSKDAFGKFKENATVNTRIQNAVKKLKDETVNFIAEHNDTYKNLRTKYRTYKQLDEIGDTLLGKDGALGQRIKGAATVKRAIQSNSDAGARQFLTKLKELTGYDAIQEGDIALTAMENVGDYQGLSLLNILKEGKKGVTDRVIRSVANKVVGNNEKRVKNFIESSK